MAELFNNDLQLLTAMLAPRLRTVFKDNYHVLNQFINPELVKKLVDIEGVMPKQVTPEGFKDILSLKGIDANDIDLMVAAYTRAYNPDTEKLVYESVRRSIYTVYINSLKQGGVMNLLESIKSNELFFPEYGLMNNEYSRVVNLADLSANTANIDLGRSFRSSFGFINSLTIGGNGYYQDQVIVISSPPGTGKSLFCISEAISACKQGMKVLYTALGDLTDFDFMSRPCSIALNRPMMSVVDNLVENYNSMLSKYPYMTNFDVDFESPGTISVSDWVEKLKHSNLLDTHDVFIVDYDTNFKSDKDNIYMKGDEIYTSLVLLAKTYHKIVIVVAQPKQEAWDSRKGGPMGLNALAESSRKQQHVDIMITLSPDMGASNSCNVIGTLTVNKNRRGGTGHTYYLREPTGRFSELSTTLFTAAKSSNDIVYYKPFDGCKDSAQYTSLQMNEDVIDAFKSPLEDSDDTP